jgi:hypothetical protein
MCRENAQINKIKDEKREIITNTKKTKESLGITLKT